MLVISEEVTHIEFKLVMSNKEEALLVADALEYYHKKHNDRFDEDLKKLPCMAEWIRDLVRKENQKW